MRRIDRDNRSRDDIAGYARNSAGNPGPFGARLAYIFLDESGNFDFSANGTRYFLLTSISMHRPFGVYADLESYKYDCIENGGDVEYFHCYDDHWAVRDSVFGVIAAHLDEIRIDCLVIEKRKTRPALQEDKRLYQWTLGYLLRRVLSLEWMQAHRTSWSSPMPSR